MTERRKDIEKVEELDNFPFKSFSEYRHAVAEGKAGLDVDRSVALNWSYNGIHSTSGVRLKATIFSLLPFIAALGFIVYIVMTGSWLMLLWLPVLAILFFMFHPSGQLMFGFIRTLFVWGTFIGLFYSFFNGVGWLLALTLTLAVIWWAQRSVYKSAIRGLVAAANKHEDLLCTLWQRGMARVSLFNGDYFWVDHKNVGGEYVSNDE